jgi:hypothetical protein
MEQLTVQQLMDELQKIEDKSKPVHVVFGTELEQASQTSRQIHGLLEFDDGIWLLRDM